MIYPPKLIKLNDNSEKLKWPPEIKLKEQEQFIFYDRISSILSVINVLMRKKVDSTHFLSHTTPLSMNFYRSFYVHLYVVLCCCFLREKIAFTSRRNSERVAIFAKNQFSHNIFYFVWRIMRQRRRWEKTINTHRDRYFSYKKWLEARRKGRKQKHGTDGGSRMAVAKKWQ